MKRMRSIALALLLAVLALTACQQDNGVPERAKELGYFVYPGLDWAMPEDEVFEALEIDKADCGMTEKPIPGEIDGTPISVTRYYDCEGEFLGDPVSLQLTFQGYMFSPVYRLTEIWIRYPDETTREDFIAICGEMEKMVEGQGIEVEGSWLIEKETEVSWKTVSAAKRQELPEELRMKYKRISDYVSDLQIQTGVNPSIRNVPDPLLSRGGPLSTITASWNGGEVPVGLFRANIVFKGDEASWLSFIDLYDELFGDEEAGGVSSQP